MLDRLFGWLLGRNRPTPGPDQVWSEADMARDLGIDTRTLGAWVALGVLRYTRQTRWGEYEFGSADHAYNVEAAERGEIS